jgi:K+-sensing histidine kinase KdpD
VAVAIRLREYLAALAVVALAAAAAQLLRHVVTLPDPALVFLIGVLCAAVVGGLWPSILAAVASLLVYDFFFVDPVHTLSVTKSQDVVSLFVFLVAAVLTSHLTARIRNQAEAAQRREQRTAALYEFTRELAAAEAIDDIVRIVARHVVEQSHGSVVVLLADRGKLMERAAHPPGTHLGEAERPVASPSWADAEVRGDASASPGWFYAPLSTARGTVGVLALQRPRGAPFPLDQLRLLEAMAGQAALAIERTRLDAVLAEQAKTEAVIAAIEDGLIVLDTGGVVVHANEVACAILQVERAEIIGERFDDLASRHPHYLRLRAAVGDFLARPEREADRVEITLFLRGRDHHFILRPTPFQARDGAPGGLILALQDVTYLRDQEAHREALVATLSHELRTPITSLSMAQELLLRNADNWNEEQRQLLESVREDVGRLQDVAQRLLDLSRARAMTIALERRSVDLQGIVARVMRIFSLQAREKNIEMRALLAEHGLTITGDETKLTWAVSNLLSNALRYTPAGGRVEVEVTPQDGAVRVAVSDTGPGIPPEQRERIFERFTQVPDGGEMGSAGLGLAIVRDIVQAHGGRIHVESTVGRGSRFVLEIPRG